MRPPLRFFLVLPFITLAAAAAPAKPSAKPPIYANGSYTVHADRIVEGGDTATAQIRGNWPSLYNARHELVRPFLRGKYPMLGSKAMLLDVLYTIALHDLEVNVVAGTHFRVSPDFHFNMLFTRDTAYSSLLGANYAFPGVVKSHLRKVLELRREIGFTTARGQQIPIPEITAQEKVENLTNNEFFEKYSTHPYGRRTDDVCWVPGFWAALQVERKPGELEWFVDEFAYFDRKFYAPFFDPTDNLYRGQASFIDVGGTGYPAGFSAQDAMLVKALSTNCLYFRAFTILADACRQLGRSDAAAAYAARAEKLRAAIQREFLHADGYYAYFKHRDGKLEPRREQLGSAFLVRFDVLPAERQRTAVAGYARNDYGVGLFDPFFPGTRVYHNNAIWPFANMFFDHAVHRVERTDEVVLRTFGTLARHAFQGNFNEVIDYATGGRNEKHARQYIWSAAAYLSFVYDVLLGLQVDQFSTLRVNPHLPAALGDELTLRHLVVQGTRCDVTVRGSGRTVIRAERNGLVVPDASIPLDGGQHTLVVTLGP